VKVTIETAGYDQATGTYSVRKQNGQPLNHNGRFEYQKNNGYTLRFDEDWEHWNELSQDNNNSCPICAKEVRVRQLMYGSPQKGETCTICSVLQQGHLLYCKQQGCGFTLCGDCAGMRPERKLDIYSAHSIFDLFIAPRGHWVISSKDNNVGATTKHSEHLTSAKTKWFKKGEGYADTSEVGMKVEGRF
jgi:hypothetical protein